MSQIIEGARELLKPAEAPSDLERILLASGELVTAASVLYASETDQASRSLVRVLVAQSLVNVVIKSADVIVNTETPHVEGSRRSIFTAELSLGMNIAGRKISETRPTLGRALELGGIALGIGGSLKYGLPNIYGHFTAFLNGKRKPWFARPSADRYLRAIPPDW